MLTSHLSILFAVVCLHYWNKMLQYLKFYLFFFKRYLSMKHFEMSAFPLGWRQKLFSIWENFQTSRISVFLPKLAMKPSVHNHLRCLFFFCSSFHALMTKNWSVGPYEQKCLQLTVNASKSGETIRGWASIYTSSSSLHTQTVLRDWFPQYLQCWRKDF